MKKSLYKISFIAILSLLGCNEDFLEIAPEDSLSKAIFFETQGDFEQAVNAAYAPLRDVYEDAWGLGDLRSDNGYYKHNPAYRATQNGEQSADFLVTNSNGHVLNKYVDNFLIISRANQILDLIDGVEFDQSAKDNIKGQALFLRALSYFDLVQHFGQVPLHITTVTNREEAALPLSSTEELYTQILADVGAAVTLLPNKSDQEAGRATSGAALMLLANAQIVQENWGAAESTLSTLVSSNQYELVADYNDVFSIDNKNNSESIFEVQYLAEPGFSSSFMYDWLPMPLTSEQVAEITGVAISQAATEQGFNIPTPDLMEQFNTTDLRKTVTLDSISVDGVYYPYAAKFFQPHNTPEVTGVNGPVYRYAEALLFYAEALNENGKTGEAEDILNEVQTRAGITLVDGLSQDALRQAIFDERRLELAFENKRWLDLVRTDNVQSIMSAFGQKVKDNPQDYYYPAGIAPPPAAFVTFDELFPLPASESLLNPNF